MGLLHIAQKKLWVYVFTMLLYIYSPQNLRLLELLFAAFNLILKTQSGFQSGGT